MLPHQFQLFWSNFCEKVFKDFSIKKIDPPPLSLVAYPTLKDHELKYLTNLKLPYLRLLQHNFQLFWSYGFLEEEFPKKKLIIFPLKRAWPFNLKNLYLLHSMMLCAKFG